MTDQGNTPDDAEREQAKGGSHGVIIPEVGTSLTQPRIQPSTRVAIVSEAFANAYFPAGDALGHRVRLLTADGPQVDIVGISKDYKIRTVGEAPRAVIHFAAAQRPSQAYSFLTRTAGDTGVLVRQVEQELRAMEPQIVFLELGTLDRMMATSMLPISLGASVFAGLAGLALMLAGIAVAALAAVIPARRAASVDPLVALRSL